MRKREKNEKRKKGKKKTGSNNWKLVLRWNLSFMCMHPQKKKEKKEERCNLINGCGLSYYSTVLQLKCLKIGQIVVEKHKFQFTFYADSCYFVSSIFYFSCLIYMSRLLFIAPYLSQLFCFFCSHYFLSELFILSLFDPLLYFPL